jgi:uncharacterized protein YecE (DUF72 family)
VYHNQKKGKEPSVYAQTAKKPDFSVPACRLWVGTSGYSYAEWADEGFYPAGTPPGRMLPVYARFFCIVELNYTWYQMPKPQALERMASQAPPDFRFTAKLTRSLTHEVEPAQWHGEASRYRDGISVLIQSGQLMAILAQFPPNFDRVLKNRKFLATLLDELDGIPLAVEFRHRSWAHDRVFDELERRKITLVTVDTPSLPGLFPSLDVITNPELFYIRFHGRNERGWRSGSMQKQFDYHYTDEQLSELANGPVAKMARQARSGVIFFNNHVRGQAVDNAGTLLSILADIGLMKKMTPSQTTETWTAPLFI